MAEKLKVVIDSKANLGAFNALLGKLPSLKTMALGAGVAVAGMGAAIFAIAKTTATSYDKIQKFSDQLGISTEFLSKMQVAADFSGVAVGTMNKSLQKLTVGIGETHRGLGIAKDAFEQLGIETLSTTGQLKTAEELIPELAEKFGNMTDATLKAELASKLFGQRGIEMLQIFKGGSAGLKEMTDEAEKFGLVVSAKAGANAAAFNDSLTRLTGSFKGLKNYMAEQVMPTITALANRMADWVANNRDRILEFGKTFISTMGKAFEYGAYGVAGLIDAWRGLKMVFEVLKIGFSTFTQVMVEGLSFLTGKMLAFMEAVNVGGVFDGAIENIKSFQQVNEDVIFALEQTGQTAYANINKMAGEGLAIDKVTEFTEQAKTLLAELGAEGQAPTGIYPFTDENIEKTRENMAIMSEEKLANLEALREMYDEETLSEQEKLDEWYSSQLAQWKGHQEGIALITAIYKKKKQKIEAKDRKDELKRQKAEDKAEAARQAAKFQLVTSTLGNMAAAAKAFGKSGFKTYKALAIAEATISTYQSAIQAFQSLSSIPIVGSILGAIAAAAAIAFGMAQVSNIRSQSYQAHAGLTYVPREDNYLLSRGERVLAPGQNRDFTEFISGNENGGGGETIINTEVHILENATSAEALLEMSQEDWEEVVEDKIIPSLNALAQIGLKPAYV